MSLPAIGGACIAAARQFPPIRGSAQVSSQLSGSTFSPTLPTHQAGDFLLVLCVYNDDGSGAHNISNVSATGWGAEFQVQQTGGSFKAGMALFSKKATTGSTTITINNPNGDKVEAIAYAVMGAYGSTASATTVGSADPPACSPGWGIDATLWLAAAGNYTGGSGATAPSGFSDLVSDNTRNLIACADRQEMTATMNPGPWTNLSSGAIVATIGIRPA